MARSKSQFRKGKTPKKPSSPIRRDLDTLIQGVSQQPPHLFLAGQGKRQLNGWSSPVEGLSKRNATRLQSKISDDAFSDFYLEMMSLQPTERYSVLVRPGTDNTLIDLRRNGVSPTIKVHGTGLTATPGLITCAESSYLHNDAGDFYKKYALINSGPIGLLLNREKVTAFDTDKSATQAGKGIIFVRAVAYNVTYTLTIDGTEVGTVTTPAADADVNELSTSDVARQLKDKVDGKDGYKAEVNQYVVYIQKEDGTNFDVSIDDGRSSELAVAFTNTVQTLGSLPVIAPNGYVVEVESDPSTTLDNRWLRFKTFNSQDFSEGAWQETVKPGIGFRLNPNTMPYVIYRAAENVFFVGPADGAADSQTVDDEVYNFTFPKWGERTAGDEISSPEPEFIGEKIRDHVLFRSRYVLASGETVQLSETDDIFNFFNDTAIAVQATDPFGLRGTSERSSPIEWMIPVEDSILAFSSTSQYQVRAADADVLTPLTGEIFRLSNLEMNSNVRPKLSGAQVLFATEYFGFTHFREFNFYNQRNTRLGLNLGSSLDVTNYVPKYIEGSITHWDVGQDIDAAVAISPTNPKQLFVYKYLWQTGEVGQQKVQRSWSQWEFNQDVQWVKFMENVLYLLTTDDTGTYFSIQLNDELEVPSTPQIHLDRLCQYPSPAFIAPSAEVTGTYDSTTDTTTFTLPYTPVDNALAIVRFVNDDNQGLKLGETTTTSLVCTERGDWTEASISFGEPYKFEYEFNTGFVPDKNETETRRIGQLAGRTQILRWTVNHVDTGAYTIRITRQNRTNDTVVDFRARTLDVSNNTLDSTTQPLDTGSITAPVCSRNDRCSIVVESDSWLPVTVTSASWKGVYSDRENAI
jgi:hypothetical protein